MGPTVLNMHRPHRAFAGLLIAALAFRPGGLAAEAGSTPRSPAELSARDFFRPPPVGTLLLNPAGTHFAFTAYEEKEDSSGLRIMDVKTRKVTGFQGTAAFNVSDFRWAGDQRLVFTMAMHKKYAYGLYSVDRDNTNRPILLNENDVVRVLGRPKDRPENILVWPLSSARNRGKTGPAVELELPYKSKEPFDENYSNARTIIKPPPDLHVVNWLLDRTGEVRYVICGTKGIDLLYRRGRGDEWTALNYDLEHNQPLAVANDPNSVLIARQSPSGQRELLVLNTTDGSTGPVLHSDPKYNFGLGHVVYSADENEVIGLTYFQQAPYQVWLRETEAALQDAIDAALPANHFNLVVSRSRDGSRLIVLSSSDRHPGKYYLYDTRSKTLTSLANLAPWLPEQLLGPTKLMSFPTRDGLKLDAYLTLPANHDTSKPAPLIVLPHGGPWARDLWGFNPEAQFFASRGYLVVQPNYRGSTGYNDEISLKPRMEFRKMHDDVTDAVHLLIKAGLADPKRIAIVGTSFGGYLAVSGAAFEPDLYRCAVTIAGVFDWERIVEDTRRDEPDDYFYDWLVKGLGDPKAQQSRFDAMSPINATGNIKIPVFIAHGEDDRRVDSSQSHRLASLLSARGIPTETMFVSNEGHGFGKLSNRVELYERIESFLKKYL